MSVGLAVLGVVVVLLFVAGFFSHLRDEARDRRAEREQMERDWLEARRRP
jgi:hypothetical protein